MPLASTVLMVRPAAFAFNEQTAANNFFQSVSNDSPASLQTKVLDEFDAMVEKLRSNGIDVLVIDDTTEPSKPDAIFPNNWICTLQDGTLSVFPMYAPNRRIEKRDDILKLLSEKFNVTRLQDWSEFEAEGRFLEGTGSMIIDHEHKIIYACASERTNIAVLEKFAGANGFQAIVFVAVDRSGRPIYHTNVMMTLGDEFCVLCEEAFIEEWELIAVRQLLSSTNHQVISISLDQMHCFAGNMLLLQNSTNKKLLVLSQSAFDSLRKEQVDQLSSFAKLLPIPVPSIEQVEGGSVRCMMAEIFLTAK